MVHFLEYCGDWGISAIEDDAETHKKHDMISKMLERRRVHALALQQQRRRRLRRGPPRRREAPPS